MKIEFFGEEKEVFEVVKKGGRHKYYTIFEKEAPGVVNEDTDELRSIKPEDEQFVKVIRIDWDSTDTIDAEDL